MENQIFSVANAVALVGWVLLAALPRSRWAQRASTWLVPGLLALVYVAIVAATWGRSPGGFSSLTDVALLFDNRWMLLAGWLHYLAFDLFIGCWITRDARAHGIAHGWVLPSLTLTFLFGPAGWLSYLGLRTALRRRAGAGPGYAGGSAGTGSVGAGSAVAGAADQHASDAGGATRPGGDDDGIAHTRPRKRSGPPCQVHNDHAPPP